MPKVNTKSNKQISFKHLTLSGRGGTRTLAVGSFLPKDWHYVRVSIEKMDSEVCLLKIERLA